jgi:hypothetical protein
MLTVTRHADVLALQALTSVAARILAKFSTVVRPPVCGRVSLVEPTHWVNCNLLTASPENSVCAALWAQ